MIYSVVIPIKNEEENIPILLEEVALVMNRLEKRWELILVDDGSSDQSLDILKQLKPIYPMLRVIVFEKNAGQSSAFDAGFRAAKGEFVITLDGDLQNDPQDIPALLSFADQADLVCGIRLNRKDRLSKKMISRLSNYVRSRVCQDGVQDTGCSLKIYRRKCLEKIKMYQGMHRFLPALFSIEGFRIKEVPVHHRERVKGKSNYHFFNRSLSPFIDMFFVAWMRRRHLKHQIKEEL